MSWNIVERKIGRAGGLKERMQKQKEWDKKYGQDNWMVGYMIDGEFISQEDAIDKIYYQFMLNTLKTIPKIWKNEHSHKISIHLSPLHIKVCGNPKMTLEKFWQDKKCLALWEED